ncbi:MAG: YgfZ/GcvT domain-containing protein [Francisellaceae bacterium]
MKQTHRYEDHDIIHITGADCLKYLQGQVSSDISTLNPQNPIQLSALCNQKGRVIGLFFIHYIAENDLLIAVAKDNGDNVLMALKKYAIFSKIHFDYAHDYQLTYDSKADHKALFGHSIQKISSEPPRDKMTLSKQEMQQIRIKQRLPVIDGSNSERFLPAELELDKLDAISYSKGCYMGQEIIARMKYRGNLKKVLYVVEIDGKLDRQDKLFSPEEKSIADIVNLAESDTKTWVLAVFNNSCEDNRVLLAHNQQAVII